MSSYYALIAAGGVGKRMNSTLPKQFLLLEGIPVLMRTIHAFHCSTYSPQIIVVLSEELHDYWMNLCYDHKFHIPHTIVAGGSSRFQSVKNGLDFIQDQLSVDNSALISIHDGARPLITAELIDNSFDAAAAQGAVTLAIKSTDSVRLVDQSDTSKNKAVPREQVYLIQTPQTFKADILNKAYQQAERPEFTDDASVVESIGQHIDLIEGDFRNLKITRKEDLAIASTYLKGE